MGDTRSGEELAGGFIRCRVGGKTANVTTLKIREEREWRAQLAKAVGDAQVDLDWNSLREGGDAAYAALLPLTNLPSDLALDLIVAYDKGAALGGKEWLEDNADSAQVYQVLLAMCRVVFPFVNDLRSAVGEFLGILQTAGVGSAKLSSTNGHSPTGDSTLNDSSEVLIPAS